MAYRDRFAGPHPFHPVDPEAFRRLPPAVKSAMRQHNGDAPKLFTALEKILPLYTQARRIEIQQNIFRAAYGGDMQMEGGEGGAPLPE
ncbi:TPA: hypothetical protein DCL30_00115 [Candidatus Peribacteria bacterium]|nr:MAG: hypothetical protein A2529_03190 [Candidatus Peribacteria bacterium RIFOXYD2_FULL_58_15]HAI97936.1 hypothetical protein [Candidatus Peribacteria bacterium]HAS34698.1 hypothetical protein [Candidatus Peribacteria bacterium]